MTASLTTFIAQVQAMFIDDGTRFPAATITAATRQALNDFNDVLPQKEAEIQDVVPTSFEYALTDLTAIQVLDVLLEGTDSPYYQNDTPLPYKPYMEDNRCWLRLKTALTSGSLVIRYTIPQTVLGLDGGVESTLLSAWDPILLDGICYYCCLIRAASRIEVINLNADVPDPWQAIAEHYQQAFQAGLAMLQAAALPDKSGSNVWLNF
jgi:hypothetical protein